MVDAAAVHKGSKEQLHRYWVAGEGLAKWVHSPHPWTALHRHLAKYISDPEELDRTTSAWHNEIMKPTGSDAYRVEHGGKMRGKRIGPG
jgi:uncharacterized protein YndB with AHSA1/START domain